jgi:hypothetical protein
VEGGKPSKREGKKRRKRKKPAEKALARLRSAASLLKCLSS